MPIFRIFHIVYVAMAFALGSALRRLHFLPSKPPSSERFRLSLESLGTTFIKFGQALSIRRDILPDDYVVALQKLQDHVSPFPASVAVEEIERGLGRPVAKIFAEFDETPLAAASVAQVHAAHLRDGRSVIVKVRRPGLKRQINQDMRSLFWLARVATVIMPRLRHYQPLRIVTEIWTNLLKEIDFCREARSIRHFVTAFADWATTINRLRLDAADTAHDLPSLLSTWVQQLAREGSGLGLSLHVRELKGLHEHLDRSSNRLVLALIAAGLFVSGALLMKAAGPTIFGEVPVFAAFAFALALWFTLRLLRAIFRSGRL